MQLFITEFSPYVRMTRILLREKGLQDRVKEITAHTRTKDSPYYEVNLSGRVPYLLESNGADMHEVQGSRLILEYLDQLDASPMLETANKENYWEYARLEESALVVMDGVSVWSRELKRPVSDRSQVVIDHETTRAARMLAKWETEIDNALMCGPLNYPQLTLACALCMDQWNPYFEWRSKHPKLAAWLKPLEMRSSFTATAPPAKIHID